MYGFIEVKDLAGTISAAVSQIQAVRSNEAQGCTTIRCGDSDYTTLDTYDDIMQKIRAEIIWILRNTKEEGSKYGFIETKEMAGSISIAVSQIQAVRSNESNGCTAIQCGNSNYTTLDTYDDIMRKIRAEIIWILRNTKEDSTNE